MLSETLHLCSDSGRLRTVEDVRSNLILILTLMEEIDDEKLPKLLKSIRAHLDDILVPFRQVERIHTDLLEWMPEQIVDALALAWLHDHLFDQSYGKKKQYHRRESDYWLTFSDGILDDQFDEFKLTFRAFSKWFVRNDAKPSIHPRREAQQVQNTLL
jgi:hypothetical protein